MRFLVTKRYQFGSEFKWLWADEAAKPMALVQGPRIVAGG